MKNRFRAMVYLAVPVLAALTACTGTGSATKSADPTPRIELENPTPYATSIPTPMLTPIPTPGSDRLSELLIDEAYLEYVEEWIQVYNEYFTVYSKKYPILDAGDFTSEELAKIDAELFGITLEHPDFFSDHAVLYTETNYLEFNKLPTLLITFDDCILYIVVTPEGLEPDHGFLRHLPLGSGASDVVELILNLPDTTCYMDPNGPYLYVIHRAKPDTTTKTKYVMFI